NTTFHIGATPFPGLPVRVFANGIELQSPRDYQVSGTSVTFSPADVPSPGDDINAFYFVQASNPASTTANATQSQPVVAVTSEEKSISNQLLLDAMNREMGHVLQPQPPMGIAASLDDSPSTRPTGTEHYLSSLNMLQRRLRLDRAFPKSRASRNASREVSADGLEGLGDVYVPGPFDDLTPSEDSELDRLLQAPNTDATRTPRAATALQTPSSLRMLVNLLQHN
ncbi:MAG: hypothetical protein WA634_18055, partial [Silvibacterium sp.]